jgi:hypothetical protein
MQSVIMQSVIMLNVVLLSVMAPLLAILVSKSNYIIVENMSLDEMTFYRGKHSSLLQIIVDEVKIIK